MASIRSVRSNYAKRRADLKKAFYSLKKQGFVNGSYKDTDEYKRLRRAESSAIYRYKNKDKINEARRKKRIESKSKGGMTTATPVDSVEAYKAFRGGASSGYFRLINQILKGRSFYGFIEVVRAGDGFPNDLPTKINNPYFSMPGYFKKVRQIIDYIQSDTEREYLWLSVLVSVIVSYDANKVVVTHVFDFSNS